MTVLLIITLDVHRLQGVRSNWNDEGHGCWSDGSCCQWSLPCPTHGDTDSVHAPGLEQEDMTTPVPQMPPQRRAERVLGVVVITATKLRKVTSINWLNSQHPSLGFSLGLYSGSLKGVPVKIRKIMNRLENVTYTASTLLNLCERACKAIKCH